MHARAYRKYELPALCCRSEFPSLPREDPYASAHRRVKFYAREGSRGRHEAHIAPRSRGGGQSQSATFGDAQIREGVGSLRAAAGGFMRRLQLSTRGSRGIDEGLVLDSGYSPGSGYDVAKGSLETFDPELEWYNAHNWR